MLITACASGSTNRYLKRLVNKILQRDKTLLHMPYYTLLFNNNIVFTKRNFKKISNIATNISIILDPEIYYDAKLVAL